MDSTMITMTNETIAKQYLDWFGEHYTDLKLKYWKYCQEAHLDWDEDVFSNTYIQIYDTIAKNGLQDPTEKGFDNYTFRSFKQNIKREKQYCRIAKRDLNVTQDKIPYIYETWYNENNEDERQKLLKDLMIDFSTLYVMTKVEDNFDAEHFLLFRLKYLIPQMTYKKLQEKTQAKKVRQKVVAVKNFIKQNVTKDEIKQAFMKAYGNLI